MYEPVDASCSSLKQVPLDTFVKNYHTKLPQVVVIHESLYGSTSTLRDGELLEVYFKKETPVVTMKMSGYTYTVPVNTSYKFSYLYSPTSDLEKARKGYVFETVADLMKAVPLPNVVYVSKECKSADKRTIIKKGQLLIVKEIGKSSRHRSKLLKCMFGTNDIYLKESCEGHFSTQESLLVFPLFSLLKMNLQWPISTSLYNRTGDCIHPRFHKRRAILYNTQTIMESLITSCHNQELKTSTPTTLPIHQLTELRSTLPFEVHIANLSQTSISQLKQKTLNLSGILSTDMIHTVIHNTSSTQNTLQQDLLLPSNNDKWLQEITSIDASSIYEPMIAESSDKEIELPPPVPPRNGKRLSLSLPRYSIGSIEDIESPSSEEYSYAACHKIRPRPLSLSLVSHVKANNTSYNGGTNTNNTPTEGKTITSGDVMSLTDEYIYSYSDTSITTCSSDISLMSIKETDLSSISTASLDTTTDSETQSMSGKPQGQYLEFNTSIISNYDTTKVVDLLGLMGLVQYVPKFKEEFITGRLLMELDDDILREELGMTKRLHRMRLLMIISGKQCVSQYVKDN